MENVVSENRNPMTRSANVAATLIARVIDYVQEVY